MENLNDKLLCNLYIEKYKLISILPESLLSDLVIAEFKQGEQLCVQGEPSEWFFFLLKGKVKIYTSTSEGKRLVVAFNSPFELFGDIELIQNIKYMHSIEAVSNVLTFIIRTKDLHSILDDSRFSSYLLTTISRKFFTKSKTLSFHLLNDVEVRLSSYLLSTISDEFGEPFRYHINSKEIREIAEFIGTSIRHQNRILKRFEEEGIVERNKHVLLIRDIQLLRMKAQNNIYEMQ